MPKIVKEMIHAKGIDIGIYTDAIKANLIPPELTSAQMNDPTRGYGIFIENMLDTVS